MTTTILHHPRSNRLTFGAIVVAILLTAIAFGAYQLASSTSVAKPETSPAVVDTVRAGPNQDLAPDWTTTSSGTRAVTGAAHVGPNQDLAPDWTTTSSGTRAVTGAAHVGPNQDLAPDWTTTSSGAAAHAGPNQDLAPDWTAGSGS